MKISTGKMVKIHYTLKDKDGKQIDSSVAGEPLEYMHGTGILIPGLERQIDGMEVGEKKNVVVDAKEGYGEYDESLVQAVPRDRFDANMPIEVGQQFQADTPTGPFMVRVTKVTDDEITVDGNHELAGIELHFDIEVIDVRNPSEEELNALLNQNSGGCGGGCGGCGGCGGNCGDEEGGCNCDGGCN